MRLTPKSYWEKQIPDPMHPEPHPCFCIGPQNGQPECPCAMRNRRNDETAAFLKGFEAGKKAAKEKGGVK